MDAAAIGFASLITRGIRSVPSLATGIGAVGGLCRITRRPYAFAVGFELQTELMRFGSPLTAFGHTGLGGSTHGCWPDEGVGFSYAMTELWPEARDDRGNRLLAALAASLS